MKHSSIAKYSPGNKILPQTPHPSQPVIIAFIFNVVPKYRFLVEFCHVLETLRFHINMMMVMKFWNWDIKHILTYPLLRIRETRVLISCGWEKKTDDLVVTNR